jgi:hypothetical protein
MPKENVSQSSRVTTLDPGEEQNEKSPVAFDDDLYLGKGNLLYLEDVCYDPIDRLVGLLEEHPSSEEIKCLLLSILSQGKAEAFKTSLMASDGSRHTESTTDDTESSLSSKLEKKSTRKTVAVRRLVTPPGTRIVRQRSASRSNSERPLRTYSGTGLRTSHQSLRQKTQSKQLLLETTSQKSGRPEHESLTRRERSPKPKTTHTAISKVGTEESDKNVGSNQGFKPPTTDGGTHDKDGTSIRVKTRSFSGKQSLTRSSSDDLKRWNASNSKQRRSRSVERDLVSKSLNNAIENKPVCLSLSAHNTHTRNHSLIDTNQRLSLSLHQNSGRKPTTQNSGASTMIYGTSARWSFGRLPAATAANGNPSLEGAVTASFKNDQPTRKADEGESSTNSKHSTDTCVQFHPDGVQEIDAGKPSVSFRGQLDDPNNILKRPDVNSYNSVENKNEPKGQIGIYGFLKRQLSKEKLIGKRVNSTSKGNESDIESSSDDSSFSSFDSDRCL